MSDDVQWKTVWLNVASGGIESGQPRVPIKLGPVGMDGEAVVYASSESALVVGAGEWEQIVIFDSETGGDPLFIRDAPPGDAYMFPPESLTLREPLG